MIRSFFYRFLFSPRAGSVVRRIARLSILSVSVGVAAFILVLSVMTGLNHTIFDRLNAFEAHAFLVQKEEEFSPVLERRALERLQARGNQAFSFESQDVILRSHSGLFRGAVAKGVSQEGLRSWLTRVEDFSQGRRHGVIPFPSAWAPEPGEVILGSELARFLDVFEGDTLSVVAPEGLLLPLGEMPPMERVRVARILSTHVGELDGVLMVYVQGESLQALEGGASQSRGIEVWTEEPLQIAAWKELWSSLLPEFRIETWLERNSALMLSLFLEKIVIGLFLGIAALVASLSIFTVMGLLVSQKIKEIGILQAMGGSARQIRGIFRGIGLCLSFLGLAIGMVVGTLLALYIQFFPLEILPEIYADNTIPAKVSLRFLAMVFLVGSLIAFLGSYLPTRTIASGTASKSL